MTTSPAQQWAGVFVVVFGLLWLGGGGVAAQVVRGRVDASLREGWKFHKGDLFGAADPWFDDSSWEDIALPHTWNSVDGQAGGDRYYRGPSWYRLRSALQPGASGRRFFLQFDGANLVTEAYVNGTRVGQHKGGFAAFRFDATAVVHPDGDNLIAVRVDNELDPDTAPLSADFTFFGGLYRMVHLVSTEDLHLTLTDFGSSAVYLQTSNVNTSSADLQVTARVVNDGQTSRRPTLETTIVDASGQQVQQLTTPVEVTAGAELDVVQTATISHPQLWDGLASPYLYKARVRVLDDNQAVDEVTETLGFRSFSVDASTGFWLNGHPYRLYGVNKHQDRLDAGWAVSDANLDEDWSFVREIGATAVRLAHYQHAQHTYDLADQGGQIVWAELPIINRITDSAAFGDNARQQLTELIRQNFNHPSIALWSISNEANLTPGPDTRPLLDSLNDLVHREDPTRLSTHASAGESPDVATDVFGSNRYFGWYYGSYDDIGAWADRTHAAHPEWRLGISEYGAGSSASLHADAPSKQDHTEDYQNRFHETYWLAIKDRAYLWGTFVWNLFDFASAQRDEGDTPGRNDKGLVSYDRTLRKDAFYWYQANWTRSPLVYITDRRFDPRPDATLTVTVYSNVDSVDLKLNGADLGSQTSTTHIFRWPVVLHVGANLVEAIGARGSGPERYSDQVTWTVGGPDGLLPDLGLLADNAKQILRRSFSG